MNWHGHDLSQGACAQERRRCRALCLADGGSFVSHTVCQCLSFVVVCWFMAVMAQVHGLMAYQRCQELSPTWFASFLRRIVFLPQEADRSRSGQGVPSPKPEVDGHRFSRDLRVANGNFEFGNLKRMAVQCCHGQQKRQVATTFRKTLNWNLSARIWRTVFLRIGNRHRDHRDHRDIGPHHTTWGWHWLAMIAMGLSHWLLVKAVVKPQDETMAETIWNHRLVSPSRADPS